MPQPESRKKNDEIPTPEWIVAGAGLVIVCLILAFLLYKAFFVEGGNPRIRFTVDDVVKQDGGSLVLGTVTNTGGETVTDLHIHATAGQESREVTIDFVPARSSREFGMFFSWEASADDVTLNAGGYQKP